MTTFRNSLFAATALTLTLTLFSPANAADAAEGEKIYRQCMACHSTDEGVNRVGPSLYGILGRTPGAISGYRFSPAMTAYGEAGAVWDDETLDQFITNPRGTVAGTKMAFPGLRSADDRANLIAYLNSLSD